MQAFCDVLCGDNLLLSLSLPSLRYQSLVKIARTLLFNRDHIARELVDLMMVWYNIRQDTNEFTSHWHQRWLNFRTRISADIDQLRAGLFFPESIEHDLRDVVMCLLRNIWNFPKPEILDPAMEIKFDARGALNTQWMFEDYVKRTVQSSLAEETLYELLNEACILYQDGSVQLILCELLQRRFPALVPSLRDAGRAIHINGNRRWHINFELASDVDDPALWETFVTTLNDGVLGVCAQTETNYNTVFSFEQNVLKVTIWLIDGRELVFLWPKLTISEKLKHALNCFVAALEKFDVHSVIRVLRVLDNTTRMKWITRNHAAIILCFLKHPYDRLFLPDSQLVEDDDSFLDDFVPLRAVRTTIHDTFLEGKFCSNSRNVLVQQWDYFSSRNEILGDQLYQHIKLNIDLFETEGLLFRDESQNDLEKAVYELHQFFHQQAFTNKLNLFYSQILLL